MTDKKHPKSKTPAPTDTESVTNEPRALEVPEFIYDKRTGNMTLTTPSGEQAVLRTTVIEDEDEKHVIEPLTVEEFARALNQLKKLGLVWTADNPPIVRAKDKKSQASFGKEEFFLLQQEFPNLPREVGIVVFFAMMGTSALGTLVGGEKVLRKKADLAKEFIITNKFRSEFFFKHAIKVPYLAELDWEVVFKLSEQGVSGCPSVSYGIVSLLLREPSSFGIASERKALTVAINEELVDKFIASFQELRKKLQQAQTLTDPIGHQQKQEANKTNEL